MKFQAYLLGEDMLFVPIGDSFEARTCLDAVQQAREYWPGLSPIVEEEYSRLNSKNEFN